MTDSITSFAVSPIRKYLSHRRLIRTLAYRKSIDDPAEKEIFNTDSVKKISFSIAPPQITSIKNISEVNL